MKVVSMDLGRLRVGHPDWLGEVEHEPSDPTVYLFSEPLEELRAELRGGLDRFRAECAPRVGPQVTCRGEVVSEPVIVPVDPPAYLRYRFDQVTEALKLASREIGAKFESFGRTLRNAFGGKQ